MRRAVYIDTNILIAAFEMSDVNSDNAWRVLDAIRSDAIVAVTSELTLAELLPKPLATQDEDLVEIYERFLGSERVLDVVPVSRDVLVRSAQIRAGNLKVKLPDALHFATALDQNCPAFLTSDLRIRTPEGLQMIRLTPTSLEDIERLTV